VALVGNLGNEFYKGTLGIVMILMKKQRFTGSAVVSHWIFIDLVLMNASAGLCTFLVCMTNNEITNGEGVGPYVLFSMGYLTVTATVHLLDLVFASMLTISDTTVSPPSLPMTLANLLMILIGACGTVFNGLFYSWQSLHVLFRAAAMLSPGFWVTISAMIHAIHGRKMSDCPMEDSVPGYGEALYQQFCSGDALLKYLELDRCLSFLPGHSVTYCVGASTLFICLALGLMRWRRRQLLKLFIHKDPKFQIGHRVSKIRAATSARAIM
jgi:hypothetical protein